MSNFGSSVRHGLRNLLDFRSRDNRARFWPYAGAVLGVCMVAGNAVFIATFVRAAVQAQRASRAPLVRGEPVLPFDVTDLVIVTAAVAVVTILLLAAAITRRLHDRDLRGRWALVPLVLLGAGLMLFARLAGTFEDEPDPLLFAAVFANNLLYLASVAALIWQLARAGSPGENRFGPPSI